MNNSEPLLVSFKSNGNSYTAYIPLNQFLETDKDVESILKQLAKIYQNYIVLMRENLAEIENFRSTRKPLPARLVWKLGGLIFKLTESLETEGFQIDGIYEHLVRDLQVKRKWLEKVIILRRYVPKQNMIPETLNWGRFEKGTRKKAEGMSKGIIPG